MATERERLELELLATDAASSVIDKLTGKVDALDGETAEVALDADDQASRVIDGVDTELSALDGEEAEVKLSAEDKATDDLNALRRRCESLEDEEYEAVLAAEARKADTEVKRINALLAKYDGDEAEALLTAKDEASAKLQAVSGELDGVRSRTGGVGEDMNRATENMHAFAGSALGELPGVGEAFSPLAETASQMAEGLLNGEIGFKDLAKAAGPIAGITVLMIALNKAIELKRQREEWREEQIEAYADAIEEAGDGLDGVNLKLRETRDLTYQLTPSWKQLFGGETEGDVLATFNRLGIGVDDVTKAIEASASVVAGTVTPAWVEFERQVAAGGATAEERAEIDRYMAYQIDATREATTKAAAEQQFYTQSTDSLTAAYGRLLQNENPLRTFGGNATQMWADMADGAIDSADNVALVNRIMEQTGLTAEEVLQLYHDSYAEAEQAAADFAGAVKGAVVEALEEEAEGLETTVELLESKLDLYDELNDGFYDQREAVRAATKAEENYAAAMADTEGSAEDQEAALDDVAKAHGNVARSAVENARATAQMEGRTLSAVQALDIENRSLLASASTLNGEMRQAVLDHIGRLNGIPDETVTQIGAAIERGDIAEAERLLNEASRARMTAITTAVTQASLTSTRNQIDGVSAPRSTTVTVDADTNPAVTTVANLMQRLNTMSASISLFARNLTGRATGDPHWRGGQVLVGEQGPEVVELPQGSEIVPNHRLDSLRGSRGDTHNTTVINNWPAGTSARQVELAQRRYVKRNGLAS